MHDFGKFDLFKLKGVFKAKTFYKTKSTRAERTFTIIDGPGASHVSNTPRTLFVKWDSDGSKETISSYDIELLIKADGTEVKAPVTEFFGGTAPMPVQVVPDEAAETKSTKPRGRAAWKDSEAS